MWDKCIFCQHPSLENLICMRSIRKNSFIEAMNVRRDNIFERINGSIPDSAVIQTRSVVQPDSIDSNVCFICKEKSFKRDYKLHKIESSEHLDSLMSCAKEHNDLMMLKTLNKPDFLASAVYHSGWRVLFIIRGALEDFYCIRRHLKLNLKKLSSQLMRLPLTALFLESVMTFLYTRKLFLCLIF